MDIVGALLKVALLGSAWVLYLLLALSVVSFGVMAERTWFFARNSRRGGDELRRGVLAAIAKDDLGAAEKVLRDSATVQGTAVANALAFRRGGPSAFTDALQAEIARSRKDLDRGMNYLGTLGSNAPFIGLFGTVIGVIGAFHELGSAAARAGAMGGVMSGIAEALVATGVGLFVALPAVIAYNVGQKRAGDIEGDAMALGHLVSAWLELRAKGATVEVPQRASAVSADPVPSEDLVPAGE